MRHISPVLLDIGLSMPYLDKKGNVPTVVLNQLVATRFTTAYPMSSRGGYSVHPASKTTTAAFTTPALDIDLYGRKNINI